MGLDSDKRKRPSIAIAGGYPHHLVLEVQKAFERHGWQTYFFDTSPKSPVDMAFIKPLNKLVHGLRIKRHPNLFQTTMFSNLGWRSYRWLRMIRKLRPDLALVIRGNNLAVPWLSKAGRICPHYCWFVESHSRLEGAIQEAESGIFQKIFAYANNYVIEMRTRGIDAEFFPHGVARIPPEERVRNQQRQYDWCFIGSHSPWREECIRAVAERLPNGYLVVPRWKRAIRSHKVFRKVLKGDYHAMEQAYDVYLSSRIGLDVFSRNELGKDGITMRFVELLACGCPVVTQPAIELERLPWHTASRVGYFTSPAELTDACLDILSRRSTPEEIELTWRLAKGIPGYDGLVKSIESLRNDGRLN